MTAPLTDYPNGHAGHLSEAQEGALADFRKVAQESGHYSAATTDGGRASHDEETLLRYLRARKFVVEDALALFVDTETWRKENRAEAIYEQMDTQKYELTRRLYPQWLGRRDRRGIPIYLFEIKHLTADAIKKYDVELAARPDSEAEKEANGSNRNLQLFALYENLLRFVMPLTSTMTDRPYAETTPVSLSNNIVDISGVGFKQFWNLKNHMQSASEMATAHYPETLDRIFIIGAPYFFSTVWGWINRWFDPGTVSKIFILSDKEVKPTLEKYIDIEHIPVKYGGKLDFEWGDMPLVEQAIHDTLEWTKDAPVHPKSQKPTLPKGPVQWRVGTGEFEGYHEAVAVGTEDGIQRQTVIARTKGCFGKMRGVVTPVGSSEKVDEISRHAEDVDGDVEHDVEKRMEKGSKDPIEGIDVQLAQTQLVA